MEGEGGGQSGVTESYTAQSVVISLICFQFLHIRCSLPDRGEKNLPINEAFSFSQVLCPGPWGEPLLKTVGLSIPLNPMKIPVYYWR